MSERSPGTEGAARAGLVVVGNVGLEGATGAAVWLVDVAS